MHPSSLSATSTSGNGTGILSVPTGFDCSERWDCRHQGVSLDSDAANASCPSSEQCVPGNCSPQCRQLTASAPKRRATSAGSASIGPRETHAPHVLYPALANHLHSAVPRRFHESTRSAWECPRIKRSCAAIRDFLELPARWRKLGPAMALQAQPSLNHCTSPISLELFTGRRAVLLIVECPPFPHVRDDPRGGQTTGPARHHQDAWYSGAAPCRRLPVVVLLPPPSCLSRHPQPPLLRPAHSQVQLVPLCSSTRARGHQSR